MKNRLQLIASIFLPPVALMFAVHGIKGGSWCVAWVIAQLYWLALCGFIVTISA